MQMNWILFFTHWIAFIVGFCVAVFLTYKRRQVRLKRRLRKSK